MAEEDNDKYLTFLRETHRKVKLPASDHDRVILADARRLLETRNEELDRVKDTVTRLIKARKALIDAEDANLRDLYDSRIVEKHVKCRVYVDARGGGMIKLVRSDNGEIFGEPRPLTKEEREAFSSTKSQTGLYDAGEPAMNEALAKKLKLTEFMADDPPVDPQQRVARVLSESALPEDLRDALLALDTEEEDPGEALREAKAAKAKEDAEEAPKKRGRPKKTPPPDAEPGPEKAEKDPVPGPPKPPRKPVQDEPPEPTPEYAPQDFDGMADAASTGDAPEPAAEEAASENGAGDPDVQEAEEAAGGDVPAEDEEPSEEEAPVSASDFDPPPESTPAPASEEDFADFVAEDGSEPPSDTEEPAPAAPPAEDPPAAPPEPEAPAAPAPEPVATDPTAEETPAPAPAEPKKPRGKKKADAPTGDAPEPATPPAVPTHTLNAENHFGLGEKLGVGLRSGILTCVKVTPVFSDRAVPILTAPGANNGRTVRFKDTWAAATIPILDDLATAKEVRRRDLPSGITVWWHEKHDATIDTVIAGYARDGGTSFMAKLGKP